MLVTTYQHDYVPPYTRRYKFAKDQSLSVEQKEKIECQCVDEHKIDIPKMAEKEYTTEWTGVAPMGCLIDPRIIPTKFSKEQVDAMVQETHSDCFKEQPNRFLKTLRTSYPDLYERLKQMPKDELKRRLERDRIYTTYQVDFCNINEYPEGIYESLKNEDESINFNANKPLQQQIPCAVFKANDMLELTEKSNDVMISKNEDQCKKAYKPFKISFADSNRFINSGDNSHWRSKIFTKKPKSTEYMDTINKIGCVILKNNIHDHKKCKMKYCRHQLVHACTNLKQL